MKWGLIWLFGAVALTLSACGVTPYDVPVSLERPTQTENIGNGTTVAVTIEDDRDDLILGNRNFDAKGASITSVNMLPALEEAVVANLEASGFQVVPSGQASDSQLLISLRKFNYALDYNLLHGWHTLGALLNADAKKASGKVSKVVPVRYQGDTALLTI